MGKISLQITLSEISQSDELQSDSGRVVSIPDLKILQKELAKDTATTTGLLDPLIYKSSEWALFILKMCNFVDDALRNTVHLCFSSSSRVLLFV